MGDMFLPVFDYGSSGAPAGAECCFGLLSDGRTREQVLKTVPRAGVSRQKPGPGETGPASPAPQLADTSPLSQLLPADQPAARGHAANGMGRSAAKVFPAEPPGAGSKHSATSRGAASSRAAAAKTPQASTSAQRARAVFSAMERCASGRRAGALAALCCPSLSRKLCLDPLPQLCVGCWRRRQPQLRSWRRSRSPCPARSSCRCASRTRRRLQHSHALYWAHLALIGIQVQIEAC